MAWGRGPFLNEIDILLLFPQNTTMHLFNIFIGGLLILLALICLIRGVGRFSKFNKDREDLLIFAAILFLTASTLSIGLNLFSKGIKDWPKKKYILDPSKVKAIDYSKYFKQPQK